MSVLARTIAACAVAALLATACTAAHAHAESAACSGAVAAIPTDPVRLGTAAARADEYSLEKAAALGTRLETLASRVGHDLENMMRDYSGSRNNISADLVKYTADVRHLDNYCRT
jgi:hypothetical protein